VKTNQVRKVEGRGNKGGGNIVEWGGMYSQEIYVEIPFKDDYKSKGTQNDLESNPIITEMKAEGEEKEEWKGGGGLQRKKHFFKTKRKIEAMTGGGTIPRGTKRKKYPEPTCQVKIRRDVKNPFFQMQGETAHNGVMGEL